MKILHLATIIPSPIKSKIPANDILLRIAEEYERKYSSDTHSFILILPYTPRILSYVKPKWREYYQLINHGEFHINGRLIFVVGIPAFRYDLKLRHFFARLGYFINKRKIRNLLETIKPDIIHAHNMGNIMEMAEIIRRKHRIDFIVSTRNLNSNAISRLRKGDVNPKSILSLNYVAARHCRSLLANDVKIIPHPVDYDFFVDPKQLRIDNKPLSIVTVSSLIKCKNIDKILSALMKVEIDFNYTIIGDGPEIQNLRKIINNSPIANRINFSGFMPNEEVKKQLRLFDLFILVGYPETLGRVYFQAMASGVPVIASKNTGIDGLIENGVHGFLINPDAEEIAKAVIKYNEIPRDDKLKMKMNCIIKAKDYTWDKSLKKYYALYHDNQTKT